MGADPLDYIRQMKSTGTDPYSGGRNFVNNVSVKKWNVLPISSPIEVQYSMAPGTAIANKRVKGGDGITIVSGGDAGTAESDFATCLVWSVRPGNELPILIIVTNNNWGISTRADTQHSESQIANRGKSFGIKTLVVNGLDPEESYTNIKEAMDYVRKERKPAFIEARVSRLYGHSSASGANFVSDEADPLKDFEQKLESQSILTRDQIDKVRQKYNELMLGYARQARAEPQPDPKSIWDFVYAGQKNNPFPFLKKRS
jgi:2-oxoisovalerate dehydrogenase E1 component alpha subunit